MREIELYGYWRQILRQRLGEYQEGHWMSLKAHTICCYKVSNVAIHLWLDELEFYATYGSHLFLPYVLARSYCSFILSSAKTKQVSKRLFSVYTSAVYQIQNLNFAQNHPVVQV